MPLTGPTTAFPAGHAGDPQSFSTSGYNYPTTAWVLPFVAPPNSAGTAFSFHLIWSIAAPGSDFNNAPNGSLLIDRTNFKAYIKTADSTWTVIGSQS